MIAVRSGVYGHISGRDYDNNNHVVDFQENNRAMMGGLSFPSDMKISDVFGRIKVGLEKNGPALVYEYPGYSCVRFGAKTIGL